MPHDSRWPAWLAVVLGLLVLLLILHVATPRIRLTSGEHLGHPTPAQAPPLTEDRPSADEAESFDGFSNFSGLLTPHDLP